uniref:Uncharacterized protein n=1 Tax=Magallana gigas TaxID=29159 RepID=K1PXP8_MAGGI
MKQRFERKGIKIPVFAKNGALLFLGFCAWHYLGVTYYNAVSAKGQAELRREGVPESEIDKLSGYRKVMYSNSSGGEVKKIHFRTVFGELDLINTYVGLLERLKNYLLEDHSPSLCH